MEYYFEVYDNDEYNGLKCSRSEIRNIKIPNKDEIESIIDSKNTGIKDRIQEKIIELQDIQNKLEKINKKILSACCGGSSSSKSEHCTRHSRFIMSGRR